MQSNFLVFFSPFGGGTLYIIWPQFMVINVAWMQVQFPPCILFAHVVSEGFFLMGGAERAFSNSACGIILLVFCRISPSSEDLIYQKMCKKKGSLERSYSHSNLTVRLLCHWQWALYRGEWVHGGCNLSVSTCKGRTSWRHGKYLLRVHVIKRKWVILFIHIFKKVKYNKKLTKIRPVFYYVLYSCIVKRY